MKNFKFTTRKSLVSLLISGMLSTIVLACAPVQPADEQISATVAGLEIVSPWARAAAMKTEGEMPAMGGSEAMTETQKMGESAAMTGTEAMTDTAVMGGSMGMGMGGAMSAAYMTIRNVGSEDDRLIKAQSDVSQVVELHTMEEKDGVMSMHPVEAIDVPANGSAELKPGGFHVMFIGLTRDLNVGEQVTVTLTFEKAGEVTVQADVRERK